MTVQGYQYHPDYLVRFLGRFYNELVIRNAFQVSTSVSTQDVNGRFEIIVDNRYPITTPYGFYHIIQPMDYVEIFMRRDFSFPGPSQSTSQNASPGLSAPSSGGPSVSSQQLTPNQIQSFQQWGYVDVQGRFNAASPVVISSDGSAAPFLEDPSKNGIAANGGFPTAVYPSNTQVPGAQVVNLARPLSPAEKANTPTFVFCGLVDSVTDDFVMNNEGIPTPVIRITGRSMGKILAEHEVFVQNVLFNILQFDVNQLSLLGMHPTLAIIQFLNLFLKQMLGLIYSPAQSVQSQQTSATSSYLQNQISEITLTTGQTVTNYPIYLRNLNSAFTYAEKYTPDGDPSDGIILYDSFGDSLGRLLSTSGPNQQEIFHLSEISNGPLISTVEQLANCFFNELWVDECGRLVLRRIEDAWFQPIFVTSSSGEISYNPDGTPLLSDASSFISAQDVVSWSLTKSDNDLKTLVLVQDLYNLVGYFNTSDFAGAAPLTEAGRSLTVDTILEDALQAFQPFLPTTGPNSFSGVTTAIANTSPNSTASENTLDILNNFKQYISKQMLPLSGPIQVNLLQAIDEAVNFVNGSTNILSQPLSVLSYQLDNDPAIIRFWQDFLLRPVTISSVFTTGGVIDAIKQAEVYFQQLSVFFSSGIITVKGSPLYKAGKRYYVQTLNADFYVTGVEHNFPWGSGPYLTTLHVVRGQFHGRPGGFYPPGVLSTPDFKNKAAAAANAVKNAILAEDNAL